jgi:hypothetical protein
MPPKARLFLQPDHLVIRSTTLWELKGDTTTSQFSVNLRVGVESVINTSLLLLVKNDLQGLASILLGAETLANNLDWVDEIAENSVVDGSECSGTRSLLGEGCSGAVGSLWARKDTTRCEDEDVTVRKLLLELAGETVVKLVSLERTGPLCG